MVKAVVFDLDDTLFPERDYVISGFRACAGVLSKGDNNADFVVSALVSLFSQSPFNVFNRYIETNNLPFRLLETCLQIYRSHKPDIHLSSEAEHILAWLKEYKVLLGLLTDGRPEGQRAKIESLKMDQYMDAVIITDELGGINCRKPNLLGYEKMMQNLSVLPQETIYIGDNPAKDFIAPNALGMISVLYTGLQGLYAGSQSTYDGSPQYTIDNLMQLKEIVLSIQ